MEIEGIASHPWSAIETATAQEILEVEAPINGEKSFVITPRSFESTDTSSDITFRFGDTKAEVTFLSDAQAEQAVFFVTCVAYDGGFEDYFVFLGEKNEDKIEAWKTIGRFTQNDTALMFIPDPSSILTEVSNYVVTPTTDGRFLIMLHQGKVIVDTENVIEGMV